MSSVRCTTLSHCVRGEITKIVLHPDNPPVPDVAVVPLTRPPAYIVVRLERTKLATLDGLDECEIPIETVEQTFNIEVESGDQERQRLRKVVRRRQLPITAAYAFTDYRSQGQTIPYVIVDIAKPPAGRLSLFNLYVALSRSSGRQTIRIFQGAHDETKKARVNVRGIQHVS
ncbi:uncharacterized protein B0H18DRAFT_888000 [Fomitopsis serialis]|uniref:uncharacterized protein n=1 Tax=Fomitopsis serialis TaxID=139415 RepID=UPI002007C02B|nr:uncharacterized protein B0H18DRAFT_888000 [Neoantrodia serialis]KAH9913591.1 hypothetical protein B0H18DRAFT_888000 [Neoantrodia serialis]